MNVVYLNVRFLIVDQGLTLLIQIVQTLLLITAAQLFAQDLIAPLI